MHVSAGGIIATLGLQRHPEGGWYSETFRDNEGGGRGHSTAIYFLLEAGDVSAWHRVKDAAEVWHFHAGAPLELTMADGHGDRRSAALGADLEVGELVADGAQPGRMDPVRLHGGARFRVRAVRTGAAGVGAVGGLMPRPAPCARTAAISPPAQRRR